MFTGVKMRLIGFISVISLIGCAAMEKDFVDNSCNYNGGFEYGTNEANEGSPMNSRRFNICPEGAREEARRGYADGYTQASESKAGNKIIDGIAGAIAGLGGGTKDRYSCSADLFGTTYVGTGATEAAAKSDVNRKCKAGEHSVHCHAIIAYTCKAR